MRMGKRKLFGPWTLAVVITLAVMGKYLFISTRSTLWDRDEPRYARVTVEMVESGNYLVPCFNGRAWPDKPVLLYWLMSVPVRLFGPTEFACRFFGAVGTALSCLLTFFIGKRLLGAEAGLWAMVILALTLMMLGIGASATADPVLLSFIVAVVAVFVDAVNRGIKTYHVILMGIGFGAGMLAKGPIGLLPVPVIAVGLWLKRADKAVIRRYLWGFGGALVVGVLIFTAWAVPANNATGGEFLRVFIGRHVLSRALKPMEHHGGNFLLFLPYYLPVIIAGFFPWTLHLPGAISAVIGRRVGGRFASMLLIWWAVSILVIMTLAATKLPHYILFIWPSLALAVGGTIEAAERDELSSRDRAWLRGGVWFFGPLAIAMSLGLMIGPWFVPVTALRLPCLASGAVLLAMTVIAVCQQLANRPKVSAEVLLVGMLVFEIPFMFGVLPAVEQVKISPFIARAVNEKTAKEVPVATYKYGEPTLNFYLGRQIEPLGSEEAVNTWSQQAGPGVLIIPAKVLSDIQQRYGDLPLQRIGSKEGLNYSKGKVLDVLALIRRTEKQ